MRGGREIAQRLASGAQSLGRQLGIEAREQRRGVAAQGSRAVGRHVERTREPWLDSLDSLELSETQALTDEVEMRLSGLPVVRRVGERSAGLDAVGARRQREGGKIHELIGVGKGGLQAVEFFLVRRSIGQGETDIRVWVR